MPTFLGEFGYIGILLIIAILVPLILIILPIALRYIGLVRQKPNPVKNATYECGLETVGPTWVQFNFRYYLFALLFVIFDIETVFLYPWVVAYGGANRHRDLVAWFTIFEVLIFMAILVVGLVYAWKKKALEWK
jgi:NADH-quinone oxidoreductase subunit A